MMAAKKNTPATVIPWDRAVEIFRMGMENQAYLDQMADARKPKALFFGACLLLCRYRPIQETTIAFLNGKLQNKLFQKYVTEKNDIAQIRHGRFFASLSELKSARTIYSGISRIGRIRLVLRAKREYRMADLKRCGGFWDWVEYSFIRLLLANAGVNRIMVFGHYDRYITWLSYLSYVAGITFEMHQHGLEGNGLHLPHKVYCSRVYCFSDNEKALFVKNIIQNEDCLYSITGFVSTIVFETFPDKKTPIIVIVGERIEEECVMMAKGILALKPDVKVIIAPHPGESRKKYDFLLDNGRDDRILLEFTKRYSNIDVLIAVTSSLVHDYLADGYTKAIVAVKNDTLSYDIQSSSYYVAGSYGDVPQLVKQALEADVAEQ